jgi:hypothetical protein
MPVEVELMDRNGDIHDINSENGNNLLHDIMRKNNRFTIRVSTSLNHTLEHIVLEEVID